MTEAAFKACYSEWRMIKTRATVQLVFEIPIEQADAAYQALGGMPIAAKEVWCGIARLNEKGSPAVSQAEKQPVPAQLTVPAEPARADKSPAQIAGYLCTTPVFQTFLREKFNREWITLAGAYTDGIERDELAADVVRHLCKVNSRRDIRPNNIEWKSLMLAFKLWEREAEVVPA